MKKLFTALALFVVITLGSAQETFLVFEFMKVEDHKIVSYLDTESFWEKIHVERVKNGSIVGWDLWSLLPGGSDQGYQYLTVTVYNDVVKAFEGDDIFIAAKKAYPSMTEKDLSLNLMEGLSTRVLGQKIILSVVKATESDFKMEIGTVNRINLMKVKDASYGEYEKGENEVFFPIHQNRVELGEMAHWSLARVMFPGGSKVKLTHMTFDMFKDYTQMKNYYGESKAEKPNEETLKKMEDVSKQRDLFWTYHGRLLKKVR